LGKTLEISLAIALGLILPFPGTDVKRARPISLRGGVGRRAGAARRRSTAGEDDAE
jgi:hypothetical protein